MKKRTPRQNPPRPRCKTEDASLCALLQTPVRACPRTKGGALIHDTCQRLAQAMPRCIVRRTVQQCDGPREANTKAYGGGEIV
jgi:hypothetical protein